MVINVSLDGHRAPRAPFWVGFVLALVLTVAWYASVPGWGAYALTPGALLLAALLHLTGAPERQSLGKGVIVGSVAGTAAVFLFLVKLFGL